MLTRSRIAFMLLINYLLVVGAGCVNRPEDERELLLIQISETGHNYQQCRYMRMDGLEAFLVESLASRDQSDAKTARHQLISVVSGVDAHHLAPLVVLPSTEVVYRELLRIVNHPAPVYAGVFIEMDAPPWSAREQGRA